MHKKNKENTQDWTILYVIAGIALILSVLNTAGILPSNSGMDWRCNYAECSEYVEISGQEWAQDNCFITEEETVCVAVLEDGIRRTIPLKDLNLNEITATKCVEYICTDEIPFRKTNYVIELEDLN